MAQWFSYSLFFKPDQWVDVLRTLAEHAEHKPTRQVQLQLSSGKRLYLPFGSKTEMASLTQEESGQELNFYLSLLVAEDEVISERLDGPHPTPVARRVSPGQVALGPMELDVYLQSGLAPQLVEFYFMALSSHISWFFTQSISVKTLFLNICEKHQGICGYLDTELEEVSVFWLEGKELNPPVQMTAEQLGAWLKAIEL